MDSVTPQGQEHIDSELFPVYQLILDGKSEELAKMVKKNQYLIYQIVELITERIFIAPDQPQERLIYCFYILKELVQEYGIPVILLFNNMDAAMKLHEVALKGLKPQVTAFLVPCLEMFSFDADKAIITYLADLYIQLNPLANSFPTKELPKTAFLEFFKKVQKVLEACQEPISGTEAEKKQLQGEVQNLLKNEDFENKDFNALEKELALYYLNELFSARDRLEPEAGRKGSVEEEEQKINVVEEIAKSPAKIVEKEENKSPVIKKSKEEEGHLARFKTSFVLNEKVYEDEGKTTEYKNYRYPFEGMGGDLDPTKVLQKTICAFLNRRGGRIYLGIHDNKSVRGLHLTQKQRDDLKLEIQGLIRTFEPDIINSEAVSIVFIPVKQSANSKPIPGLFVVKIIVKQGDTSQLYSVQKRLMECYIRNDARVDLLSARETSDHIRKRDRNAEKPVAEEEFEDPKPELLVDEYENKRFMENMNDSKVRFDRALKRGPPAGDKKFPPGQYQNKNQQQQGQGNLLQQFQQNFKAQQNMGGFVQKMQAQDQQHQQKPVLFGNQQGQQQNKQQGGVFGSHQNQNNNFTYQNSNQNQNQQVFGAGGKTHQNQNQNQQVFGAGGKTHQNQNQNQQAFGAKNNNYHHQHQNSNQNQNNQGFQVKNKPGKGGAPDWKEKWGIAPDQEIFEVAIDGLPLDMTQKEFEALVAQGNSFNIINPRKIKTKNGLTKGFANFTNIEDADKFISLFNEKKVGNSVIYVEFNFAL